MENHFAHGHGHKAIHAGMPVRFDSARHVDVAQDDAAENRALRISIARQHRDADCRIRVHEGIVNGKMKMVNERGRVLACFLTLWTKTIHEITRTMPWPPRNKGHSTVSKW